MKLMEMFIELNNEYLREIAPNLCDCTKIKGAKLFLCWLIMIRIIDWQYSRIIKMDEKISSHKMYYLYSW